MIDVKDSREACNDGIVENVIWIRRNYNLADAMTKTSIVPQSIKVMKTGKIEYEIDQSVKRQLDRPKYSKDNNPTNKKEKIRIRKLVKTSLTMHI